MPIPTSITDLSTTAASNSPQGSESPTEGDNYIRALSAIIAQVYEAGGNASYARTAEEIAASVTPTDYSYQPGDVRRYGVTGDGSTDDYAALLVALKLKRVKITEGMNCKVSATPYTSLSGQVIDGYGATITSASVSASGLRIGWNGSAFSKTDDVTVKGLTFAGVDTGSGSTYSYGIAIEPPTTNPYVYAGGCSHISIIDCKMSGHAIGVIGTAADDLVVDGCRFSDMEYHSALTAGGYSVLFQTCFDSKVTRNTFVGSSGDRHALYISADSSRTKDNNNVCKGVTISGNSINWTGASAATGFEAAIVLRAPEDCAVTGNIIRGGYGQIDYEGENGNGKNISITGNTLDSPTSSGSERGCVNFGRTSGSYICTGVTITGNTMLASGSNTLNVSVAYADQVTIQGNALSQTSGVAPVKFGGSVTNAYVGGGTIYVSSANAVYYFSGTGNDGITIGKSQRSVSGTSLYNFVSTPANLRHDYTRSAAIRANSTGSPVEVSDPDGIVSAVGTDTNGISVTFENQVADVTYTNMWFGCANSSVVNAYYRSTSGQQVVIGVLSAAGTPLAAASNNYDITVFLRS